MAFQQKLLVKAYFIVKMTAPSNFQPASSDFWKTPLVLAKKTKSSEVFEMNR